MKNYLIALVISIACLFYSCEPAATFTQPQPADGKALAGFPKRLHGSYVDSSQISILTISNNFITRLYNFDSKEHRDSIGNNYAIAGDTLIDVETGTKEKILIDGDTIIQHIHFFDTLFDISADNVLKKFKGYYFLSSRYNDSAWEVKKISLHKGTLSIGSVAFGEDVQKLKAITETAEDTMSKQFTLTRPQLKGFIREHGFSEEENFTRVNGSAKL